MKVVFIGINFRTDLPVIDHPNPIADARLKLNRLWAVIKRIKHNLTQAQRNADRIYLLIPEFYFRHTNVIQIHPMPMAPPPMPPMPMAPPPRPPMPMVPPPSSSKITLPPIRSTMAPPTNSSKMTLPPIRSIMNPDASPSKVTLPPIGSIMKPDASSSPMAPPPRPPMAPIPMAPPPRPPMAPMPMAPPPRPPMAPIPPTPPVFIRPAPYSLTLRPLISRWINDAILQERLENYVLVAGTAVCAGIIDFPPKYVEFNTAHIYIGGTAVMPYEKQTVSDIDGINKTTYSQNVRFNDENIKYDLRFNSNPIYDAGTPESFGIEVCLDHHFGYLKNTLSEFGSTNIFPVHLITSCGMSINYNNICAQKNGFVFICDGHTNPTSNLEQVVRITPNKTHTRKIRGNTILLRDVRYSCNVPFYNHLKKQMEQTIINHSINVTYTIFGPVDIPS